MENSILEFKYNLLVDAVFDAATYLNYNKKHIAINGGDELSAILKALEPEKFSGTMERLTAEDKRSRAEKDRLKAEEDRESDAAK